MPGLLTDFTISELLAENQQGHLPISSASTHPDYGQKRRRAFFKIITRNLFSTVLNKIWLGF